MTKVAEPPGFIGFDERNAMVFGDVFFPIQPLSSLNEVKEPLLICKLNETILEVLDGLLETCRVVLPAVLVDVTVTGLAEA
jgi:hypothetical protein